MKRMLAPALVLILLSGCATTPASHQEPAATPDGACAQNDRARDPDTPARPGPIVEPGMDAYDPWHRFNRGVYRFNARFDDAIHFPVASTYRRVVPREVRNGVGNFFTNLGEIGNTANHLLQGHVGRSLRSAARFVVNTTIGLAGLFDVAGTAMELEHAPTNFANTLGRWGVGAGPYLILPVLGPSSLRDGVGQGADLLLNRTVDVLGTYSGDAALPVGTLYAIDTRSRIAFRYYQTASPFEYELVRFLYTRKRAIEIHGARAGPVPALSEETDGDTCDDGSVVEDAKDDANGERIKLKPPLPGG